MLVTARADKERKYAELIEGDRCRLVVVGVETGGRWSEAVTFLDHLASARAREAPPILRGSAFFMLRRRWSGMLPVACGRALAGAGARWLLLCGGFNTRLGRPVRWDVIGALRAPDGLLT